MSAIEPYRDQLSKWKKFTNDSMCKGCHSYCCTFPVEVSIVDLRRLELISEDDMMGSPKKIAQRLKREGYVANFRSASGFFTLSQKSDESCVFLSKDRRCTVYEKRPEVCRLFPKIGPRPGYCPSRAVKT